LSYIPDQEIITSAHCLFKLYVPGTILFLTDNIT